MCLIIGHLTLKYLNQCPESPFQIWSQWAEILTIASNDQDGCFLCHTVGHVAARDRRLVCSLSTRDLQCARKHYRLTNHRSRSVTLSCYFARDCRLYPTRRGANGRFVANLVNPLLQCHVAIGYCLQHQKASRAGIFGRVVMFESDSERSGQISEPIAPIFPKRIPR